MKKVEFCCICKIHFQSTHHLYTTSHKQKLSHALEKQRLKIHNPIFSPFYCLFCCCLVTTPLHFTRSSHKNKLGDFRKKYKKDFSTFDFVLTVSQVVDN